MARARNIKPSIMDNEELAELPALTRLLFIYMWMLADREGRIEDRPARIKKQALGYDNGNADEMLSELAKAGFIERYEVDGFKVIQILAFNKHQTPHIREAASELPASTSQGKDEHQPRQVQEQDKIRDDTHLAESLRKKVMQRDGSKCLSCESEIDLHVDHIIPRALGGKTELENLQTLCRVCNQSKGARNSRDFRKHNLGKVEHSPRSPDTPFPLPDTGYLIADTPTPSAHEAPTARVTEPGQICKAMKSAGIGDVNPGHPDLLMLLNAGATVAEFEGAATTAAKKGKGFAYALGTLKRTRQDAANTAQTLHTGPLPVTTVETDYQRSAREKMTGWAPSIAAKAPGQQQPVTVLEAEYVAAIGSH